MQLAGTSCGICDSSIVIESEATWCASCQTVLHSTCVEGASCICPTCKKLYSRPEEQFVYANVCPECSTPTAPPSGACSSCRARVRFDNAEDYGRLKKHIRFTGWIYGAISLVCAK